MAIKVRIPTPLRSLTSGSEEVSVEGKTIKEVVDNLEASYKGIKERICDENGQIRKFINFYVNEEDIRFLNNQETPVKDGDQISIVPAIAGGTEDY
ncbi:MAG: MoaD/ThiS family protein [Candidatus Scalindua sp.]|nr:MoaD/ThiS family protein [Candidatus Scalindua sp.]